MAAEMEDLIRQLEMAEGADAAKLQDALDVLSKYYAQTGTVSVFTLDDINSTDATLHLISTIFPGWSVQIAGNALEPNGHYHCTLRRSAARDDDEFVGIGRSAVLSRALLISLLHVVGYLMERS
jgi:hypothetical protein